MRSIGERSLTYLEISAVYMCEVGFNSAHLCASMCLSSEFDDFEIEDLIMTSAVSTLAANTEYFLTGYSQLYGCNH